jgi:hypothetical protein
VAYFQNHSSVMEQVQKVELKELKHVETVDKGSRRLFSRLVFIL